MHQDNTRRFVALEENPHTLLKEMRKAGIQKGMVALISLTCRVVQTRSGPQARFDTSKIKILDVLYWEGGSKLPDLCDLRLEDQRYGIVLNQQKAGLPTQVATTIHFPRVEVRTINEYIVLSPREDAVEWKDANKEVRPEMHTNGVAKKSVHTREL